MSRIILNQSTFQTLSPISVHIVIMLLEQTKPWQDMCKDCIKMCEILILCYWTLSQINVIIWWEQSKLWKICAKIWNTVFDESFLYLQVILHPLRTLTSLWVRSKAMVTFARFVSYIEEEESLTWEITLKANISQILFHTLAIFVMLCWEQTLLLWDTNNQNINKSDWIQIYCLS